MSQTSKASARAGVAASLADSETQVLDAWARAGHVSMIGLFVIALLFWPSANAGETANAGQDEAATDDSDCRPPASNGVDRHAA